MAKINSLRFLPNFITLTSLFCACMGIVWTFNLEIKYGVLMIWICAVLDLFDGLAARTLKVASELGKQLDSLSDLVAFGLLPSTIIYALCGQFLEALFPCFHHWELHQANCLI